MEFKINFAYFVSLFLLVIFSVNLADEICKAIQNKRKKKVSKMAFDNFCDYINLCQVAFLVKEHNFPKEQVISKYCEDICEECGNKLSCANGFVPKCLIIDEELLEKIHRSKI